MNMGHEIRNKSKTRKRIICLKDIYTDTRLILQSISVTSFDFKLILIPLNKPINITSPTGSSASEDSAIDSYFRTYLDIFY